MLIFFLTYVLSMVGATNESRSDEEVITVVQVVPVETDSEPAGTCRMHLPQAMLAHMVLCLTPTLTSLLTRAPTRLAQPLRSYKSRQSFAPHFYRRSVITIMAFSVLSSTQRDHHVRLSLHRTAELDRLHQNDFSIDIPSTLKGQERLYLRVVDRVTSLSGDITKALLRLEVIKAYRRLTRTQPYLRWVGSRKRVGLPTECRGPSEWEPVCEDGNVVEDDYNPPRSSRRITSTEKNARKLSLARQSWFREAAAASSQYLTHPSSERASAEHVETDEDSVSRTVSTASTDSSFHMHRVGGQPDHTDPPDSSSHKRQDSLGENLVEKKQRRQTQFLGSPKTSMDQPRSSLKGGLTHFVQELHNPRIRKRKKDPSFSQSEASSTKATPTTEDGTKNHKRDGSSLYSRSTEGFPSSHHKEKSLDDDIEIPLPLTLNKRIVQAALVNGLHAEENDSSLDTIKADEDVTPTKPLLVKKTRHVKEVKATGARNASDSAIDPPTRKAGAVTFRESITAYSDHRADIDDTTEDSPSYPDLRKVPSEDWGLSIPFMPRKRKSSGDTPISASKNSSRQVSSSTTASRRAARVKDAPYEFTLYPAGKSSGASACSYLTKEKDDGVRITSIEIQAIPPLPEIETKKHKSAKHLMGNTGTIRKLKSGFLRTKAHTSSAHEPTTSRSSIERDHSAGKGKSANVSVECLPLGRPSQDSKGSGAALLQSQWSSPTTSEGSGELKKKPRFMGSVRNGLMRMGSVKQSKR